MLAGFQILQADGVGVLAGVGGAAGGEDGLPLAGVERVLRLLQRAVGVLCPEADLHRAAARGGGEVVNARGRVVHFEAVADVFSAERQVGGVGGGVGSHHFDVVGPVRQGGGVPGVERAAQVVLH